MEVESSPFIFDGPVPPSDLVGREVELAALRDRATRGRFTLLYAPRRYGKTSLIVRLQADTRNDRDVATVAVDLEGCQTLDDLARRIADAYEWLPRTATGKLLSAGASALRALRPTFRTPVGSVELAGSDPAAHTVERLLRLPYETATKTGVRVLVVFDEFQAIADVPNADAIVRSQIQHQRDRVSYLFSGSERHVLQTIFADRARPLYGQAEQLRLGPLPPPAAVELVTAKFAATARQPGPALPPLVDLAGGHPQRLALLADALWHETPLATTADEATWQAALERALRVVEPELRAVDASLTTPQRKLVRLLAWAEPPTGAAAGRLNLGKGSASAAFNVLIERSIALPRDDTGPPRLVDPLLTAWTRRRQPAP
ncbi:MAG: AAA family ATPase [Acidimicrobiales bacterium]